MTLTDQIPTDYKTWREITVNQLLSLLETTYVEVVGYFGDYRSYRYVSEVVGFSFRLTRPKGDRIVFNGKKIRFYTV